MLKDRFGVLSNRQNVSRQLQFQYGFEEPSVCRDFGGNIPIMDFLSQAETGHR
jgi:hypothetical protein